MIAATVLQVIGSGIVHVAYCVDEDGNEIAVAVEPRLADDLRDAIQWHQDPLVFIEPWQVLAGCFALSGTGWVKITRRTAR